VTFTLTFSAAFTFTVFDLFSIFATIHPIFAAVFTVFMRLFESAF